jgi:divalent metal cation (Fe/Co/Zn/Cd) transporter
MAEESTRVVYAALAGNVLLALSKFGAASISGSSSTVLVLAMLASRFC